eukprot:c19010_g1_i1.p1 GENE.c19010_g1_i1~~c19010_g1_i1.p1  ORF type:complete len:262 (+),score=8.11 c19010_g1_i1:149-934(+)
MHKQQGTIRRSSNEAVPASIHQTSESLSINHIMHQQHSQSNQLINQLLIQLKSMERQLASSSPDMADPEVLRHHAQELVQIATVAQGATARISAGLLRATWAQQHQQNIDGIKRTHAIANSTSSMDQDGLGLWLQASDEIKRKAELKAVAGQGVVRLSLQKLNVNSALRKSAPSRQSAAPTRTKNSSSCDESGSDIKSFTVTKSFDDRIRVNTRGETQANTRYVLCADGSCDVDNSRELRKAARERNRLRCKAMRESWPSR